MPLCPLGTGTQTEVEEGNPFYKIVCFARFGGACLQPGYPKWRPRPSPSARPRAGARPPVPSAQGGLCGGNGQ